MYLNKTIAAMTAALLLGALSSQAGISLGIDDLGQGLSFNGNGASGGTFGINNASSAQQLLWETVNSPTPTLNSSAQFAVTGSSTASQDSSGLSVWFTSGALWKYGAEQTIGASQVASASSTGPVYFYIGTASGPLASGQVDGANVITGPAGDSVTLNIANFVYSGSGSSDLATLAAAVGTGTLDVTLAWASTALLSQITGNQTTTPVAGSISPIPEPGTLAAGVVMLGILGAAGLRSKRQSP